MLSLSLSCALWIRTIFISIEAYNKNPKRREHFMSKKRCEHRTNRTTTEEKKKHFKNHLTVCFCELWLTLRGGVSPFVFAHSEWILYARITWINVFNRNSCFVCPVFSLCRGNSLTFAIHSLIEYGENTTHREVLYIRGLKRCTGMTCREGG